MTDTIFALSSGVPPSGIALFRISGPRAGDILEALAGPRPEARRASLRRIRHPEGGETIDHGLVLWFPAPNSATGENLAELHLHGGRAVVAAIRAALVAQPECREARTGEFARRAFENGRIDLAQAEGLADLIEAETEGQRRAALALSEGALGNAAERWRVQLLSAAALVEAQLDFSDEGDVTDGDAYRLLLTALAEELDAYLTAPSVERLKEGFRIVIAGPPNAGKSSLINILAERDVALVSDIAGTTRDRLEAPVAIGGVAFTLVDTAGLRESSDPIEAIGVERASTAIDEADLVLWLGEPDDAPRDAVQLLAKADIRRGPGVPVSAKTGAGISDLRELIVSHARLAQPVPGTLALNQRHRDLLSTVLGEVQAAAETSDELIVAERLRSALNAVDRMSGRADTEEMLDTLFGRLCIGK